MKKPFDLVVGGTGWLRPPRIGRIRQRRSGCNHHGGQAGAEIQPDRLPSAMDLTSSPRRTTGDRARRPPLPEYAEQCPLNSDAMPGSNGSSCVSSSANNSGTFAPPHQPAARRKARCRGRRCGRPPATPRRAHGVSHTRVASRAPTDQSGRPSSSAHHTQSAPSASACNIPVRETARPEIPLGTDIGCRDGLPGNKISHDGPVGIVDHHEVIDRTILGGSTFSDSASNSARLC